MRWMFCISLSALLSLLWEDVDLKAAVALSRNRHNKQKKDQHHKIKAVAGLLAELYAVRKPEDSRVFAWNHDAKQLDNDLHRIQEAAGCGAVARTRLSSSRATPWM